MQTLNIDVVGPGAWYMIHLMAAHAKTPKQIDAVHEMLKIVAYNFFCVKCRHHFRKNYGIFQPPKVNDYNELFIWTVEMHNKVNEMNDKPIIEYRDALDYYVGKDSSCTGDCGAKKPKSLTTSELLLRVLSSGERSKFQESSSL